MIGVTLNNLSHEDSAYTFFYKTGMTSADLGKAVTLDTSAANSIKLAGDGDPILGQLFSLENRTVQGVQTCAVVTAGGMSFPKEAGSTIAVGDFLDGSSLADGSVEAAPAATKWQVVEVVSTTEVIAISL